MQYVCRLLVSGTLMLIEIFHTSPAHVEVLSQPVKQITAEQSFSNYCQCCQVTRQQNMIRLRY